MLSKLKSPSEESLTFCTWLINLVNQLQQISSESFSEATSHIDREKLWSSYVLSISGINTATGKLKCYKNMYTSSSIGRSFKLLKSCLASSVRSIIEYINRWDTNQMIVRYWSQSSLMMQANRDKHLSLILHSQTSFFFCGRRKRVWWT